MPQAMPIRLVHTPSKPTRPRPLPTRPTVEHRPRRLQPIRRVCRPPKFYAYSTQLGGSRTEIGGYSDGTDGRASESERASRPACHSPGSLGRKSRHPPGLLTTFEVRTAARFLRHLLHESGEPLLDMSTPGQALDHGQSTWSVAHDSLSHSAPASVHGKYKIPLEKEQSKEEHLYEDMLFGVSANGLESDVGFGFHFLASNAEELGENWGYGDSYLVWVNNEPEVRELYLQVYRSSGDHTLNWIASRTVTDTLANTLGDGVDLEALYESETGDVTLFVNGEDQLTVKIGSRIPQGETIALRARGPVGVTSVYVHRR